MEKFFFTFGSNHKTTDGVSLGNCYVMIEAADAWAARDVMAKARGAIWAFVYEEEDFAGQPAKYGLHSVSLEQVTLTAED